MENGNRPPRDMTSEERRRQNESPNEGAERLRGALWAAFCCIWWFVAIICFIPIIVCLLWMRKHEGCGIPVYWWVIGYFILVLVFVTGLLIVPCLIPGQIRCLPYYLIILGLTALWLQACWCIYGHALYFSDDNDCGEKPATRGWMIFMIILLFIGIFQILQALFFTCYICCTWS